MAGKTRSRPGKIRYAVVGLGHIAQAAVLPAFAHARHSSLAGLVSGSPRKMKILADLYGVAETWSYEEYEECLQSGKVDAVYIALPNDKHRDFAIRAAEAGIHVLCEKPLGVTKRDCDRMIAAAKKSRVKLMTAYRLHFEETNLRASELVKSGKIGDPRYFNSCFSFEITNRDNIRLKKKRGGGTLYDIGIYCLNAARYIFQDEPIEVVAFSARKDRQRFREVDETTACLLRFPGERLATFTTSFGSSDAGYFEVIGTEGSLRVEPAFEYAEELSWSLKIGVKEQKKTFAKRDQFGAEISAFSECVLAGRDPEPSGEEGMIDVQIIEALYASARSGRAIKLPKFSRKRRPDLSQSIKLPSVKRPKVIKADSPYN